MKTKIERNHDATPTPRHQRALATIPYFLLGVISFGAILDAVSNAITIVTPLMTYLGTVILIIAFIFLEITLKRNPISWRLHRRVIRIVRLGLKPRLAATGILVLLWIPRIPSSTNSDSLSTTSGEAATVTKAGTIILNEIEGSRIFVEKAYLIDRTLAEIAEDPELRGGAALLRQTIPVKLAQ